MKKRFAGIVGLVLALAYSLAVARDMRFHESYGVQRYWSGKTSAISSNPVAGIMTGFSIMPVGGAAEFRIQHATGAGSGFTTSVSSTIYLTAGVSYSAIPEGVITNPMIEITRIDNATTVYLDIGYLTPRADGGF